MGIDGEVFSSDPNNNPELNPNSAVAVSYLKISGRGVNCREMNYPVLTINTLQSSKRCKIVVSYNIQCGSQ